MPSRREASLEASNVFALFGINTDGTPIADAKQLASPGDAGGNIEPMVDAVGRPELDARFEALRADVRTGVADLRSDLKVDAEKLRKEMAELRGDVKSEIADVRADLHKMDASIKTWMVATMVGLFVGFGGLFLAMSNALKPSPAAAPQPIVIYAPGVQPPALAAPR